MPGPLAFSSIGRLPAPDDNVAIALRRLEAGTEINLAGQVRTLVHTVLLGHRFAVRPIAVGAPLLSWATSPGPVDTGWPGWWASGVPPVGRLQ